MGTDTLGEQLAIRAAGHHLSAEKLVELAPENAFNGKYSASIWFLLGFSIELAIKAVLFARGWTEDDMRKAGHDLSRLLDHYEQTVEAVSGSTSFAVRGLGPLHSDFYFRYGGASTRNIPDIPICIAASRALVDRAMIDNNLGR